MNFRPSLIEFSLDADFVHHTQDRSRDHCSVGHEMSPSGLALATMPRFADNPGMDAPGLDLNGRPLVMGILNVTPDSFSDGGMYMGVGDALDHAEQMIRDGADIIDVGGESTRPGAQPVPAAEQIKRTQPVIAAIRERHDRVAISIDTQIAEVASAALDAGATLVNDVSALRADPDMARRSSDAEAYVVLMHMQGKPRTMQQNPCYDNVVDEVEAFLKERIEFAVSAGIKRERIIIDPGIGFGKTIEHNLQILANLRRFSAVAPVLLGTSRKSLFAGLLGIDRVEERLTGTIVTNTIGLLAGVGIVRVHDVQEARHAVVLCGEIMRRAKSGSRDDSIPPWAHGS
jgi:dihydropteroate synthase